MGNFYDSAGNLVGNVAYGGQIVAHNAAALRSTSSNDVTIDVLKMVGMKMLVVSNTLDQNISVSVYSKATNYSYAISGSAKTVNAGASTTYTDADFPVLRCPAQQLIIRVTPAAIPTSGSVSTYIEGVLTS